MNHQKRPEVTRLKVPIHDVVDKEQVLGDELPVGQSIVHSRWSIDYGC
ncbi:MAG TPA: hypothetical protein VL443_27100 [Cyclobacteriaceae bacterium]|jgi:hypothetical protein|nr:hypothetical protein [Cyclobacteriaceae bacterium]